MKKLILIILQLSVIFYLILFLINNSFIISFEIKDLIFSIDSSYVFILFILILLFIFVLQSIYFKSKLSFSKFLFSKKIKAKERGYNSFVNGMLALANKDYKRAISESKNVSKYLGGSPSLSLLLKSEVFKFEKNNVELNKIYEEMVKSEPTMNLGFRGLMEQYLKAQDYHHAFIYGEKLFNNNPYIEKIYDTLVNIIAKTNNWQQLLLLSDKAYSKKIIDKNTYSENKSIALYEISKVKQLSDPKDATSLMKKALNLRKNFPPYIKLYLELLTQQKEYNIAKKYFKKAWKENPHPEYKYLLINLADNLKISILELASYVTSSSLENNESKILLVESAIQEQKWERARKDIRSLLDVEPSREVCLLMAKIEDGDSQDIQKVNSWTLRSERGETKDIWICSISNNSQNYWSAVSEGGYFNTLQWKKPKSLNIIK